MKTRCSTLECPQQNCRVGIVDFAVSHRYLHFAVTRRFWSTAHAINQPKNQSTQTKGTRKIGTRRFLFIVLSVWAAQTVFFVLKVRAISLCGFSLSFMPLSCKMYNCYTYIITQAALSSVILFCISLVNSFVGFFQAPSPTTLQSAETQWKCFGKIRKGSFESSLT